MDDERTEYGYKFLPTVTIKSRVKKKGIFHLLAIASYSVCVAFMCSSKDCESKFLKFRT